MPARLEEERAARGGRRAGRRHAAHPGLARLAGTLGRAGMAQVGALRSPPRAAAPALLRLMAARRQGIARLRRDPPQAPAYTISETGKFAMPQPKGKTLWVTPQALQEANTALAAAGGQGGALVELVADAAAAPAGAPGMVAVTVKLRPNRRTQDIYHRKLAAANPQADAVFCGHADCAMSSSLVTGTDVGGVRKPVTRSDAAGRTVLNAPPEANKLNLPGAKGQSLANRVTYELLLDVMPRFAAYLRQQVAAGIVNPETGQPVNREARRRYLDIATKIEAAAQLAPPRNMSAFLTIYQRIQDSPVLGRMFAERYGVNEDVTPNVGDALFYLSDPSEYDAVKAKNKVRLEAYQLRHPQEEATGFQGFREDERWNFHWAGVILTDGHDYVTFENLSTEDENDRNREWYFAIYGPGAESFHSKMAADPHATAHGITGVVTSVAPPPRQRVGMPAPIQ